MRFSWQPAAGSRQEDLLTARCLLPAACYFEYNSTISCSCTGRLICSRVGIEPIFADIPLGVERQPLRHAAALHFLERVHDRGVLAAALPHRHDVARLHRERRDVHLAAVHREVAVAHELPRLRPRRGEAEAVGDVVEPPLEQLQQRLAGDAARPLRLLEVAPELVLEHAVDALDLLLLAQLHAVAGQLRLARLAVLPGREVALLDRALLRVAALALEEQLHPLAAAQAADRSDVSSH